MRKIVLKKRDAGDTVEARMAHENAKFSKHQNSKESLRENKTTEKNDNARFSNVCLPFVVKLVLIKNKLVGKRKKSVDVR